MWTREGQTDFVRALQRHQEMMSELYLEYAEQFPSQRDLWRRLAAVEREHADRLSSLAAGAEDGSVRVSGQHIEASAEILGSLGRTTYELVAAKQGGVSLDRALTVAWELEKAIMDRGWFRCFEADSPELRALLESLDARNKDHTGELQNLVFPGCGDREAGGLPAVSADGNGSTHLNP